MKFFAQRESTNIECQMARRNSIGHFKTELFDYANVAALLVRSPRIRRNEIQALCRENSVNHEDEGTLMINSKQGISLTRGRS